MGFESCIPIIDFPNLPQELNNCEWESLRKKVWEALETTGCFVAIFDKVPLELQKELFSGLDELFDLPLEAQILNRSKTPFGGYIGRSTFAPLYESLGILDPTNLEKVESFTNMFWPQGQPSFSKVIESYSQLVRELEKMVIRMIMEIVGGKDYLDEYLNSTEHLLRLTKYAGVESSEAKPGLSSHRDKNVLSILYQNHVDGLEIQTQDGEWINLELSPNSFVVMVGESLYAWSNGRLKSPYHRVMISANEVRYSVALFSGFIEGYIVKVAEELVDGEHPSLFRPFNYLDFIKYFQAQPDKGSADATIEAYCGVYK